MSRGFYLKMAWTNLKNNRRTYVPYLLTCICSVIMFYGISFIGKNSGMKDMPRGESVIYIMEMGIWVVGIFAVVFLFYTNSFLIKQRKKEFGIYNILGLEKKHIGKVMFWETMITTTVSLSSGLLLGILFSKLMFLVLLRLLKFPVPLGFEISLAAMEDTVLLFALIYAATLLYNLCQIHVSNPIELLRGGQTGEREPRTKLLMVIVGILCLGAGYYIAITTESPLQAITLFFLAVLLVIIGTYCLFTAVSIIILKMLRRNKRFYYQTKHFTSVSGMLYRMKQNAVGLANICILSTGVLLMLSTTFCLYIGQKDIIESRYPKEVDLAAYNVDDAQLGQIDAITGELLDKYQLKRTDLVDFSYVYTLGKGNGQGIDTVKSDVVGKPVTDEIMMVNFITQEDYNRYQGTDVHLNPDEVILFTTDKKGYEENVFYVDEHKFQVKETVDELLSITSGDDYLSTTYYLVVDSEETMRSFMNEDLGYITSPTYQIYFDLQGDEKQFHSFEQELSDRLGQWSNGETRVYTDGRELHRTSFNNDFGGLFFLGIFLGMLFLMATSLIIYYKQISEGYDDRERFAIMQKVGMSKKEVRASIGSQVIMVFFLPLLVAVVHIGAAFPMMTRLLALFQMRNIQLFVTCTLGTVAVFALIYGIIYALTARVYYKIVD